MGSTITGTGKHTMMAAVIMAMNCVTIPPPNMPDMSVLPNSMALVTPRRLLPSLALCRDDVDDEAVAITLDGVDISLMFISQK